MPPKLTQDLTGSWSAPSGSLYKLNVDAAIFSHKKELGAGSFIQDDKGLVVATLSKKISTPLRG